MFSLCAGYMVWSRLPDHYLLDIERAISAHESQTADTIELDPWLQPIQADIEPSQDVSVTIWPKMQSGYLFLDVQLQSWDKFQQSLQIQQIKKRLDSRSPMISLSLSSNPELYNEDWSCSDQFYKKGVIYLVLKCRKPSNKGLNLENVCLAAFSVNSSSNTLALIGRTLFTVDSFATASIPNILSYKINTDDQFWDFFFCCKGKVFSFVFVSESKSCKWIHCFHKKTFIPIGGANTVFPGLYSFGGRQVVRSECLNNQIVGIYKEELCARKKNLLQVHRLSKLYLRF